MEKGINTNKNKGFTFIEVLVVLGVFSMLVTITFSIFSSSLKIQKYSLASQQLLNQTSYVMEYMGKMVRLAKKNLGDGSEPACGVALKDNYLPASGQSTNIEFIKAESFEGVKAKRCVSFYIETGTGRLIQVVDGASTYITPPEIEVINLKFYISGGSQTDIYQPRVTIFLSAKMKNMVSSPVVDMQTTISQRDLDIAE